MTRALNSLPSLKNQGATQQFVLGRTADQVIDGWIFSSSTTLAGMSSGVRFNSATFASITQVGIGALAAPPPIGLGGSHKDDFLQLAVGDWLLMRDQRTGYGSNYIRFRVNGAPVDNGIYVAIPVTPFDPTGGTYSFLPFANGDTINVGRDSGAGTNGSTTQFLRGDGTFATPAGGSADGTLIAGTAAPSAGVGNNGDWYVQENYASDFYALSAGGLVTGPKAAGAWPAFPAAQGGRYFIERSKSMAHGPAPSWRIIVQTAWATTPPNDVAVINVANSGASFYSTAGGTLASISGPSVTGNAPSAAMAFQSHRCKITVLPDAGHYLWLGAFMANNAMYGYCVRVDSTGACELWKVDDVNGYTAISGTSGVLTISAGDFLYFERFALRIAAWKSTPANSVTQGNLTQKIEGSLPAQQVWAASYGAGCFGIATDSATVRFQDVVFSG